MRHEIAIGRVKKSAPIRFDETTAPSSQNARDGLDYLTMALHRTERPDGWESRFAAVLKEASIRQFDAARWNCARFTHACAEAVTGRSLPYTLRRSLEASVDAIFDRYESPTQAQRGDVVLARMPHDTLGVCVGPAAVFVMERGLMRRPRSEILIAWRTV